LREARDADARTSYVAGRSNTDKREYGADTDHGLDPGVPGTQPTTEGMLRDD
jgi:hypothetical protein